MESRSMSHIDASLLRRTALAALLAAAISSDALAGESDVPVYHTETPATGDGGPSTFTEADLARLRERLDSALGEAVQDLGLNLDLSEPRPLPPAPNRDDELIERAREGWVIVPELSATGPRLRLRLTAVAPGSNVLLSRSLEL